MNSDDYKRVLHRMGYFPYLEGLIRRYAGQSGGWDGHLANCRRFILECAGIVKPGKITVLGSGWLLDFPLAELLESGVEITLTDIFHPPELKKQVAGNERVKLIEEDITGGVVLEVWRKAGRVPFYRKLKSLDAIEVPGYSAGNDPGMIVSLNILSQLDVLPVRFLKSRAVAGEKDFERLRELIQLRHIELLKKHTSVLITDYEEITTYTGGKIHCSPTLLTPVPHGIKREDWVWDFDLKKTDSYRMTSKLKVAARLL